MYRSLLHAHDELKLGDGRTDKELPKKYVSTFHNPILGHRRTRPLRMLEIGTRWGRPSNLGLLYFENIHLYVVDNGGDLTKQLVDEIPFMNIMSLINAGAYSKSTLSQIPDSFDVIINDGPHSLKSQIYFVKNFINKLTKLGVILVEDIQATYWIGDLIMAISQKVNEWICLVYLRRRTGVGYALMLTVHKLIRNICEFNLKVHSNLVSRFAALLKLRKLTYFLKRQLFKSFRKFKKIEIHVRGAKQWSI